MKNKIKIFLITFIIYFSVSVILENKYTVGSLLYTAIEAVVFSFILSLFEGYFLKNVVGTIKIDLQENEHIIFETPASYKKNNGYFIGGKAIVTNQRFIFKSHFLNLSSVNFSIAISDIKDVSMFNVGADNGIQFTTANGNLIKLTVENRDELYNVLSAQR